MELTDQELVAKFAAVQDELAFVSLLRRHEALVRAVCRRVLRDSHLAEDAFQATFLVLAGQAKLLSQRGGSLAPWLQTVATNAALQLRRSREASQRRERVIRHQSEESPLTKLIGILDEELQGLDREAREAIVLCHLEGRTQDEAAQELGVSKSTLRRRIETGLAVLRSRFTRRGLMLPIFAVLWKAISSQTVEASVPLQVSELADAAQQLTRAGRRPRITGSHLSQTSWNLSQRILTMSPWNQFRRWSVAVVLAGCVSGAGLWQLMGVSQAGEQPAKAAPAAEKPLAKGGKTSKKSVTSPGNPQVKLGAEKKKAAKQAKAAPQVAQQAKKVAPAVAVAPKLPAQVQGQFPGLPNLNLGNIPGNAAFNGVININGQEFRIDDPAEFQRMLQQNQNLFQNFPAGVNGAQAFQGMINNNGAVQNFDNQADFDNAVKGLPLPALP